jgi:hypothetical protein
MPAGNVFVLPNGFFWYSLLTAVGGLIAWRATRAGVLSAFMLEQEATDKRRSRSKAVLISKLVFEFELAKADLEKFVLNPDAAIEVEFNVFYGTIKQQVEHLYAVDPSFMRLMQSYLEKFRQGVRGPRDGQGRKESIKALEGGSQTPQAGVLIKLIDEVVFMLEQELSGGEMAVYREVREADKRKRGEHIGRMRDVLYPDQET